MRTIRVVDLDDDALAQIVSHLQVKDIGTVARVCRRLAAAAADRSVWIKVCAAAGIDVPDDCVDVRQLYIDTTSLRWDAHFCHSYVHVMPGGRIAYSNHQEESYFAGIVSKPPLPAHGRFEVSYTVLRPVRFIHGCFNLGIGLVNSEYNVADPDAGTAHSSQGFWDENDGVGFYSTGGAFAYGDSFDLQVPPLPLEGDVEYKMEVDRDRGEIKFFVNNQHIGSFTSERVTRTEGMRVLVILQTPDLRVRLNPLKRL